MFAQVQSRPQHSKYTSTWKTTELWSELEEGLRMGPNNHLHMRLLSVIV